MNSFERTLDLPFIGFPVSFIVKLVYFFKGSDICCWANFRAVSYFAQTLLRKRWSFTDEPFLIVLNLLFTQCLAIFFHFGETHFWQKNNKHIA